MVVEGGMGTVTQQLAAAAMKAGATIRTGCPISNITIEGGSATGVTLSNGESVSARTVLVNADPFRLRSLAGQQHFSPDFNKNLDGMKKDGTTFKVRPDWVLW